MSTLLNLLKISSITILLSGCVTRTVVLDSNADVIRIGKNVKGEIYIYRSGQWEAVGKAVIPEGWYAGPFNIK